MMMMSQLRLPALSKIFRLEDGPLLEVGFPPLTGALTFFMPVNTTYAQLIWRVS